MFTVKYETMLDASFITIGMTYSLANIETILGVIILAIQLVWILFKCATKIFQFIKKKITFKELSENIDETVEHLESIREEVRDTYVGNDKT